MITARTPSEHQFDAAANEKQVNEFKYWPFIQTIKLNLFNEEYSSKQTMKIIKLLIQI